MKNLSIHLFFILLVINAFGQSYEPFPENNAFWSAMHCESGPIVTKSAFVKVGVFGDTLINEKTYHKLYLQAKFDPNFQCDTCGFVFDIDSASYFMCYREENKVIYFVPQDNGFGDPQGTEYPIFDFNLSAVGQTVTGYQYQFLPDNPFYGAVLDTETLTVESIDNVVMSDGSNRRRITFKPLTYGLTESWIEGIGSTKGFGWSLNVTNSYNSMICFSHNGMNLDGAEIRSEQSCTTMPDVNFPNQCEYTGILSVNETDEMNAVVVFPNPFVNTIEFINLSPKDKIIIYDILGQNIYYTISESDQIAISLAKLEKGVYFYSISSADRNVIGGKLIKQ
jgi:hypothetical protein